MHVDLLKSDMWEQKGGIPPALLEQQLFLLPQVDLELSVHASLLGEARRGEMSVGESGERGPQAGDTGSHPWAAGSSSEVSLPQGVGTGTTHTVSF